MVKLKKALKKLAKLSTSKGASRGSAARAQTVKNQAVKIQAAKKGTPVKKKSGPVPVAKNQAKKKAAAPTKAGGKAAPKKGAEAKKKPAAKVPAKKLESPKAAKGKKAVAPAVTKKANGKAAEPVKSKALAKPEKPSVDKGIEKAEGKPSERLLDKSGDKSADKGRKVAKTAPVEEVSLAETGTAEDEGPEEVILTDAEGRRYCRVKDCDQISMVDGYCRYHYLLFWKRIQVRKKILTEGKLERYIEDLTARYPDKYLEMLRKDLRTEKDFLSAITELEIDEASVDTEYEDEAQSYLEEVRGMSSETSSREEEEF